ncbi:MAG: hypothetical protein Q9214_004348 [Letrouitia sp. 1 TL-2023]
MDHKAHVPILLRSGIRVPRCIYGTAEKTDPATIFNALSVGYRGLDTACQPQYYHQEVVGQALQQAFKPRTENGLGLTRTDLFIQTKFTTPAGQQPHSSPYQSNDDLATKVNKSLERSLSDLNLSWVDALLMHGPMPTMDETIEVYKIMERYVPHYARNLGLSNMTATQVQAICSVATVQPTMVQNRFTRKNDYCRFLRSLCIEKGIIFQAFSILRSNDHLLNSKLVGWLAERTEIAREEALFCLVQSLSPNGDLCILNGTRNIERMERDLAAIEKLGQVPEFIMQGFRDELHDSSLDPTRKSLE